MDLDFVLMRPEKIRDFARLARILDVDAFKKANSTATPFEEVENSIRELSQIRQN